jgi:hypothetical protein
MFYVLVWSKINPKTISFVLSPNPSIHNQLSQLIVLFNIFALYNLSTITWQRVGEIVYEYNQI